MSTIRITGRAKSLFLPRWLAAGGALAAALFLTAGAVSAADKKAPPAWTVVKVEFKVPEKIGDPPPPKDARPAPPKPERRFEFGKDGGRVVVGDPKEVPYITISHVANFKGDPNEFKMIDGLGQELASPSTYVVGRNNQAVLVFRRDNWKQFGELYLAGPGEQRIALSRFLPIEEQASWKLKTAKIFAEADQKDKAKEVCKQILKQFPRSKAAKDAQLLLGKLDK